MKKILSLVLAVVMVLGLVPAVFALEDDSVAASKYQEAINFLALDAINLYHGGVAASEDVTRAQMALFTSRFVTGQTDDAYWATNENDSGFTDLKGQPDYMLGAISFAAQKGIVVGIGEDKFAPNDNVTYRDALTMVVRALGYTLKASQYPWGYINKALELGLMDGIEGVAYTDTIARDVVAQILYNALFADIEGTTVLESKFGVTGTFVMVTATTQLNYTAKGNKALAGCVEYAEFDTALEPTTVRYNQSLASFGFANVAEANQAVGQYFFILYNGTPENIVYAEALTDTYWNFGDAKQEIKASFTTGTDTITLGGKSLKVVNSYTKDYNDWGNIQNHTQNEVKYFDDLGSTSTLAISGSYYRGTDGNIYHVVNPYTPVYLYSAITGKYYKVVTSVNNTLNVGLQYQTYEDATADVAALGLTGNTGSPVMGFKQLMNADLQNNFTTTNIYKNYFNVSAYTKALASDANGDGTYDRVTVRNYGFGTLELKVNQTRYKKGDKSNTETGKTYVQIYYSNEVYNNSVKGKVFDTFEKKAKDANGDATVSVAQYPGPIAYTDNHTGNSYNGGYWLNGWADYINFTGMSLDELADGDGVIFYWNINSHELEIIAKADKVTGYVRDFDCYNNTITLDSKVYNFGYNNLLNAPLGTKEQSGTGTAEVANAATKNMNLLRGFYNSAVSAYVVDNKVVYVKAQSTEENWVIIDSIVAMNENGIVAKAYSTISDGLENITISALNGWSVGGYGGLDYYIYYLSSLNAGLASVLNGATNLPVETGKLYKVVSYSAEAGYNLTDSFAAKAEPTGWTALTINEWGYIIGTEGNNTLNATKYTTTNDNDYWLILVPAYMRNGAALNPADTANYVAAKVYQFNGKMKPITFAGATTDFYKVTNKDYVLVCTDAALLENAISASSNVTYVVYENLANVYNAYSAYGSYAQQQYSQYSSNVAFYNLFNGEAVNVTLANANPYAAVANTNLMQVANLVDGQIYKVVDGMLYATNSTATLTEALNYYVASGKFASQDVINFVAGSATQYQQTFAASLDGVKQAANHYAYSKMWNNNAQMLSTFAKATTYTGSVYFYNPNVALDTPNLWLGNATNYYYGGASVNDRQSAAFFAANTDFTAYLLYNKDTNKVNAYVVAAGATNYAAQTTVAVKGLATTELNVADAATALSADATKAFSAAPVATYQVVGSDVVVNIDLTACGGIDNLTTATVAASAAPAGSTVHSVPVTFTVVDNNTIQITCAGVTAVSAVHVSVDRDATNAGNNCWMEFYF